MELSGYCKKHDEREPYHWPTEELGLWMCPTCAKKNLSSVKEIDDAIERIKRKVD